MKQNTEDFLSSIGARASLHSLSMDNGVLEELRAIMGDRFGAIIAAYLADSVRYIAAIAEAVQNGDAVKAEKSAHALRSASGQVGALKLENYLGQLEDAAESNSGAVAEIFKNVQIEHENVCNALRQAIK
jgi:HPt (histidine-containing phosphotransfer) domain-containing protein